ncbi:hypothetical protein ACFUJY_33540 [Streptomyces sp. NPDC057249]|uniref:AlkZ-related protein n=1 Tax=Streptomyces sp. NPDC057249 TaxID=3346067 RepID=UPI0036380CE0
MHEESALHEQRVRRWHMDRPPLRTADEAGAYIEDVGLCLLFGDKAASLPSLREAGRDEEAEMLPAGWGEDLERVWTWKDMLPTERRAWCGRFLGGRQALLSPRMTDLLYPHAGEPDDFQDVALSPQARGVAEHLLLEGPTSMRVVREAFGLDGRGAQKVLTELGRELLITNYGTRQDGPGWPSCVIELTSRVFFDSPGARTGPSREEAALVFLDTMVEATPREVARAFRWTAKDASALLDGLVRGGRAETGDGRYRLPADAAGPRP